MDNDQQRDYLDEQWEALFQVLNIEERINALKMLQAGESIDKVIAQYKSALNRCSLRPVTLNTIGLRHSNPRRLRVNSAK